MISRRSSRVPIPKRKYGDTTTYPSQAAPTSELKSFDNVRESSGVIIMRSNETYPDSVIGETTVPDKESMHSSDEDDVGSSWTATLTKSFACCFCHLVLRSHFAIAEHCLTRCKSDSKLTHEDPTAEIGAQETAKYILKIVKGDSEVEKEVFLEKSTEKSLGKLTRTVRDSSIGVTDTTSDFLRSVSVYHNEENTSTDADMHVGEEMTGFVAAGDLDSKCAESLVELSQTEETSHDSDSGYRRKSTFKCHCGMVFCSSKALRRHEGAFCIARVSSGNEDSDPGPKKESKTITSFREAIFSCSVCQQTFTKKTNLLRHGRKFGHKVEKSGLRCQYCFGTYTNRVLLLRHQRTKCPKLMQCPICSLLREELNCSLVKHVVEHVRNCLAQASVGVTGEMNDLCIIGDNGYDLTQTYGDTIDEGTMMLIAKQILEAEGVHDRKYVIDMARIGSGLDAGNGHDMSALMEIGENIGGGNDNPMETTQTSESLECDRCGVSFKRENNLKTHQIMKCDGIFHCVCPICNIITNSASSLFRHIGKHIRASLFAQESMSGSDKLVFVSEAGEPITGRVNANEINLDETKMNKISRQILETCERLQDEDFCLVIDLKEIGQDRGSKKRDGDKTSVYKKVGYKEKMERLIDGQRQCKVCAEIFSNEDDFKTHYLHEHATDCAICEICAKPFADVKSLRSHLRIHNVEKPHQCDLCKKRFKQRCTMLQHRREHIDVRQFVCDICNASFKRPYNLKIHREGIHFDIKPFHCPDCPARFGKKSHWTKHKLIHANGDLMKRTEENAATLYPCDYCHEVLVTLEAKCSHMNMHIGEKLHCQHCGQKLSTTADLLMHYKLIHGMEFDEDDVSKRSLGRPRCSRTYLQTEDAATLKDLEETVVDEEFVLEEFVVTDGEMIEIRVDDNHQLIQ